MPFFFSIMFIFITMMTYAPFLYSINQLSPKKNSSFYLVADIWLLSNFSSHLTLLQAEIWRGGKGKVKKSKKIKEKHYEGEKVRLDLSPLENVIWFEQTEYKARRRIKARFNHCISGWFFPHLFAGFGILRIYFSQLLQIHWFFCVGRRCEVDSKTLPKVNRKDFL